MMDNQASEQGFLVVDSLYGAILLGSREQALISTPEFQRLKRLKQLGFIYLVKNGAIHTRFDHSLGVYFLARRVLAQLSSIAEKGTNNLWNLEDTNTILAASLLHDIGHYPFPQALERLTPIIPKHEILCNQIVCNNPIARILQNDWKVDPERVVNLVLQPTNRLSGIDILFAHLLSGKIDIDKLDYLNRDSFHCGLQPINDYVEHALNSFIISQVNSHFEIRISVDGAMWVDKLLEIRQRFIQELYGHILNRAATVMFSRAVQDALLCGAISGEDLASSDDESVFLLLINRAIPDSSTSILVKRIISSQFYSPVFTKPCEFYDDGKTPEIIYSPEERRRVEIELSQKVGRLLMRPVEEYDLLIDFVLSGLPRKMYRLQLFAVNNALAQDIGQVLDAKGLEHDYFSTEKRKNDRS
jgi:HD superfamily phosphohydrolase